MNTDYPSRVTRSYDAPLGKVWEALTTPSLIKEYMFNTRCNCAWTVGSPITWNGSFNGKEYEDKGMILKFEPTHTLQYTYYTASTGLADVPSNYHIVSMDLCPDGMKTVLTVLQENNNSEAARDKAAEFWGEMLQGIKLLVESKVSH